MTAVDWIATILVLAGSIIFAATRYYSCGVANVKEWLLYATTNAEKLLGAGTGSLKLRQVYDLFVERFPWMARFVTFQRFSELVDEALKEMRHLLDSNQAVQGIVLGKGESEK